MRYIITLLVALVALVGMSVAVVDSNTSGPISANGMQMVDGGQSLQDELMESPVLLDYVTYIDYNVLVVETRGVPVDAAQKFATAAIANHGYKAVYFAQGILFRADGSMENTTLDLTTPPRIAHSLGYL